jgi:hypothetical protein
MKDLHSLCVDKSSCKAELGEHHLYIHTLTKDSFKKAYQESHAAEKKQSK